MVCVSGVTRELENYKIGRGSGPIFGPAKQVKKRARYTYIIYSGSVLGPALPASETSPLSDLVFAVSRLLFFRKAAKPPPRLSRLAQRRAMRRAVRRAVGRAERRADYA